MALAGRVEGGAEAARPVLALSEELDHLFGVRASLASVALLVMLVERVGSPEAAVTSRFGTRILAPALVKLILVALPVVLALEAGLTRGAPINVGLTSCADRGTHGAESVQGAGRGNRERRLRSVASRSGLPRHRRLPRVGRPDGSMSRRTGARRGNGDARAMAKRSLRGKKHGWVGNFTSINVSKLLRARASLLSKLHVQFISSEMISCLISAEEVVEVDGTLLGVVVTVCILGPLEATGGGGGHRMGGGGASEAVGAV